MVQAKPLNNHADTKSNQIIQFNHPVKYRTSEWYTGHGEIVATGVNEVRSQKSEVRSCF